MSYRSFKRVLGETSLERKCRVLFGTSLLLLITGAFWYAERIAEKLVKEKTGKTGRDYVDLSMLRYHFEIWETREDLQELVREMSRDLQNQDYQWEIIALDKARNTRLPNGAWEEQTLRDLERELAEQLATALPQTTASGTAARAGGGAAAVDGEAAAPEVELLRGLAAEDALIPVSRLRPMPELGAYHYYQPVYWKQSCSRCHLGLKGEHAVAAADAGALLGQTAPLRVVKVSIPDRETQRAINRTRAILLATAIVTVFLAMVALYVVVRYVIVKPLNHLRDISDDISRGDTARRADIHTNDEFEDLAASFNRMLRHLVDTEQELRQVNSHLDAKVDQLAQANMQLYEMNRLKSDFLANMSHELRTPLNSIIGFSDVLKGIDLLNERQKRYVDNIGASGRVLLHMINDILDLAKMESGKMELKLSEFRIGPIVHAQCDMVRSLSEEKNIDLEVEIQPDLPPLYQDQGKVQQILTNLLSNAIKFTPEGGRITVLVQREEPGTLVLTVRDTGVGIAEEDRGVIFEKFRQGSTGLGDDNLTREYSGTGLGLSIVKELCRLLGGEVSFESELGKGSEFTIRLPWTRPDRPRLEAELAARMDELARPRRTDGGPAGLASDVPLPAAQPSAVSGSSD